MLSILDLSKKILSHCKEEMTLLKLQKLCYYNQAWYYTFFKQPLVEEEFLAEKNGFATKALRNLRTDGSSALAFKDDDASDSKIPDAKIKVLLKSSEEFNISNNKLNDFVEIILSVYGNYDGAMLSDMNHEEMPWILAQAREMQAPIIQGASVIRLDEVRDCYENQQPFHNLILQKLKKGFRYKKFLISEGKIGIKDMTDVDKGIIDFALNKPNASKLTEAKVYMVSHGEQKYEFFRMGHNIFLVSEEVKEYIMKTVVVSDVEKLLKDRKITFFWEYNDDPENPIFAYTAPELGIIVNEETHERAVNKVLEMLEYKKECYDKKCLIQDEAEKKLIDKVFLLYRNNQDEFFNLLGLNKDAQLQGEKIHAV